MVGEYHESCGSHVTKMGTEKVKIGLCSSFQYDVPSASIAKIDISLPSVAQGRLAYVLHNFLSKEVRYNLCFSFCGVL